MKKGSYHVSDKTKKQISEKLKGRHLSDETKQKLHETHLGKKPSAEARQKMSDAKKWKKLSQAHIEKIRKANIGKHSIQCKEETKLKLRLANTGKHHSEETKKKIGEGISGERNGLYGKHHSEETKALISEKCKGRVSPNKGKSVYNNGSVEKYFSTEEQIPDGFVKGRLKFSEETLHKMSLAATGENNPMYGKKISEEVVKERTEKMINTKMKNKSFHTSKDSEEIFKNFLIEYIVENNFRYQYRDKLRYPFLCDFYIPKLDLFIELNHFKSHNGHLFDKNNEDDINTLQLLQEKAKTSKFYENMIDVWTIKDPLKFETAKKNNLNYIVSYNISEMYNIIEELKKALNKDDFE